MGKVESDALLCLRCLSGTESGLVSTLRWLWRGQSMKTCALAPSTNWTVFCGESLSFGQFIAQCHRISTMLPEIPCPSIVRNELVYPPKVCNPVVLVTVSWQIGFQHSWHFSMLLLESGAPGHLFSCSQSSRQQVNVLSLGSCCNWMSYTIAY